MEIKHFFGGGVYAKQMLVPGGQYIVSHKHRHDHLSILAQGSVLVEVDGVRTRHTAPDCIEIAAGKHHMISALDDVAWYCIHATDIADVDRVDDALVMEPDMPEVVRMVTEER